MGHVIDLCLIQHQSELAAHLCWRSWVQGSGIRDESDRGVSRLSRPPPSLRRRSPRAESSSFPGNGSSSCLCMSTGAGRAEDRCSPATSCLILSSFFIFTFRVVAHVDPARRLDWWRLINFYFSVLKAESQPALPGKLN